MEGIAVKTVVKMGIVLLLAVVLCLCLGTAAHAESVIDSGYCGSPNAGRNVQWTLYDTGRLVISGEGEMESIWTVEQWWNGRQSSIKSLEIGEGVTSVGAHAFHDCTNLTSVTLPESLTTIGYYSFQNCTGLTSITLPSNVNTLRGNAFQGAGLTGITIPAGVTSISENLLRDCKSLKNVTIPGNVTVIKSWAFEGCTALEEITIPKSVGEIAYGAFTGCTSLKDFIIPAGVTSIHTDCFRYCTSLESITIPKSVSLVSNEAFDGCTGLKDVSFLGSEKQWNAIKIDVNNEALKNARHHFSAMDSGVCGDNLSWTLYNDKKLVIEGSGSMANYSEGNAPWYVDIQQILTAEISDDVTSVGDYAFYGCAGLTDVTLPESVASLGAGAFSGCTGLKSITLPQNLTEIGDEAFSGCTGLKSITLPQNLTEIGDEAFSGCIKLDDVELPENLTSLGAGAFSGCASLSEIIVPGGVTSLKSNTFKLCTSLIQALLLQGVDSIGDEAFSGCTELEFVFLNAQSIGASAFSGCVKLNDVELPEDLTSIGASAFSGCVKLKDIELPEDLTSIGEGAFSGCISLGKFTVPAGVTELKSDTFYGCTGLTEVTLPSELKSIDSAAFRDCTGLTVITIPEKVESIGSDAFRDCTGLREILLPVKLTTIGNGAFYNCGMLTDVFYTGFEQQWKLVSIGSNNEPLTDALIHYDVVPGTYIVTYFANGGTGAPSEQAKMQGVTLTLSDDRPTRASESDGSYKVKLDYNNPHAPVYTQYAPKTKSYTFRSWNTAADGSGDAYAPGALYTGDAHMKLYAQWDCEETAKIELLTATRDEAVFLGWATSRDAESGVTGTYHPTGDVTLYAIWKLPDLRLPASLTTVESEAFAGGAFTYVLVPETVTAIGPRAFADCRNLQYVELQSRNTVIDTSAFAGVPNYVEVIRPGSDWDVSPAA